MKKLFLFSLLFFSGLSFACRCGMQGIYTYYDWAKFVGEIEVVDVGEPLNGQVFVKIKSLKKYKGSIPNGFYADVASSCRVSFRKAERFLIYLDFFQGIYKANACTRKIKIDNEKDEFKRERKVLKYLSKKGFKQKGAMILFDEKEDEALEAFKDLNYKRDFTILRVTASKYPDKIDKIEVLKKIGTPRDKEIYEIIQKHGILLNKYTRLGIENEEFIVVLFYHKDNSNMGVISLYP